jgi:hypothetical protein
MFLLFLYDFFPHLSIVLCAVQLGVIILGLINVAIFGPGRHKAINMSLYITLGWCGITFIPYLIENDLPLLWYILLGGIVYTIGILPFILPADRSPRSMLLLSPPGMGKTTMLRDIARQLSDGGMSVGIADERHELAACHMGLPTLDIGVRTDVMDGCPKALAIARMLRGMAPQVIVADEIGGEDDARALADAVRCGARIVASAHALGLEAALCRPNLRTVLDGGIVDIIALLGPRPGLVEGVWHRDRGEGVAAWRRA